ncbi:MAG TPA: ATP-binding protein [Bdellovibrionota bacterium]|jgi:two-component system nitrogen regulation sensor histidine kinase NtrY|nr:ATP-binding protein [Bdellovibrionota bacterium]
MTAVALDFREIRKRRRERIAIGSLVVLFVILTFAEFRLTEVSNSLPFVNSIFFFGILNLNVVLLIALVWLIFRNIGKVFLERRSRVLGSRLKSKLIMAFLSFSIIPTMVLFVISSLYINSSFDKWFSLRIQNTLQASLEITRTYYRNADQTAMHFGEHISDLVGGILARHHARPGGELTSGAHSEIQDTLASQRALLAVDAVEYYPDPLDQRMISAESLQRGLPAYYPRISLDLLDKAAGGEKVSVVQHLDSGDMIRCLTPVRLAPAGSASASEAPLAGVLVTSAYIPVSLVSRVGEIASVFDDYRDTNPLQYPIKTTYFAILVLITLVLIFVAVWIGLFMAKQLTDPVERLVRGARAVGAGNLDISIDPAGHDEISVLIDSFNMMTGDLRQNREKLTHAKNDLEKRRQQLETVLANIGTGVLVVERGGSISTLNRAASQLLSLDPTTSLGRDYRELLRDERSPLAEVVARAFDVTAESADDIRTEVTQWTLNIDQVPRSLAAVATPLHENGDKWGVVAVIDDMTHLIKAQREVAWREVARRIAHEIKNPLTPIKLSAQRLQRRFNHFKGKDQELLKECTDTIVKHTDELKEMVNEFSSFARFPEVTPAPANLNEAVREVASLYSQAHPEIDFVIETEAKLPIFEFDRDQIKRVFINLVENSVAAITQSENGAHGQVKIETHFNDRLQIAAVSVKDNGPGMDDETRSRVFEPYFSTKRDGTGLGLAIAKRIINDHDGFIRVSSAPGEGTVFSIELPTARRAGVESRKEAPHGATGAGS